MYKITSLFGSQESFRNKSHSGVDFSMNNGTELRSIREGVVEKVYALGEKNIGNGVAIKFNDGKTAIYGHLSDTTVTEGQSVHAGDIIGHSGNSGHVEGINGGYHLHFGLKEDGQFINPPSSYINDIQHMNDANYFVQQSPQLNYTFTEFVGAHMSSLTDMFSQLKLNLVSFLFNDTMFMQIFQNTFQFITTHSSLVQDIIRSIL